jgi:hypothetical protein
MKHAFVALRNVTTALAVGMLGLVVVAPAAVATDLPPDYYICHATGNKASIDLVKNWQKPPAGDSGTVMGHVGEGHMSGNDIIPPIPSIGFEGQNWDAYGQAVHANNCNIPTYVEVSVTFTDSSCTGEAYVEPVLEAPSYTGISRVLSGLGANEAPDPGETVSVTYTGTVSHVIAGAEGNTRTFTHTYASSPAGPRDCVQQPPAVTVEEDQEGCDLSAHGDFGAGSLHRTGTREYVWSDATGGWVLEDASGISWGTWTFTPYSDDDYLELCAGDEPRPEEVEESTQGCDLDQYGAGVMTREGEREYVWDSQTRDWVLEDEDEIDWGPWSFEEYSDQEFFDECAPERPQAKAHHEEVEECSFDVASYGSGFEAGVLARDGSEAHEWDLAERVWELGGVVVWGGWEQQSTYTDEEFFTECAPEQPTAAPRHEELTACEWDASLFGDGLGAGSIGRDGSEAYVWDFAERVWELSGDVVWGSWEQQSTYTDEEYAENCAVPQPEDEAHYQLLEACSFDAAVYAGDFEAGVIDRTGLEPHTWNPAERRWELSGVVLWEEWQQKDAYDDAAYFENCAPPQPPAETRDVAGVQASCKLQGQQTYVLTYTTEYEWNPEAATWELGAETGPERTDGDFVGYTAAQLEDECPDPGPGPESKPGAEPRAEPEVEGVEAVPAAVPTAVDAGLGGPTETMAGDRNPLWLLLVGLGLGLVGLAGGRRRTGLNR